MTAKWEFQFSFYTLGTSESFSGNKPKATINIKTIDQCSRPLI